jgi:hypothetical protein
MVLNMVEEKVSAMFSEDSRYREFIEIGYMCNILLKTIII